MKDFWFYMSVANAKSLTGTDTVTVHMPPSQHISSSEPPPTSSAPPVVSLCPLDSSVGPRAPFSERGKTSSHTPTGCKRNTLKYRAPDTRNVTRCDIARHIQFFFAVCTVRSPKSCSRPVLIRHT